MLTRRDLLSGSVAVALVSPLARAASASPFEPIEATLRGGRLGFAAIDLRNRRTLLHRADERFAACSTFKLPLAAAVLAGIDAGRLGGDQRVPIVSGDLLDYAPVTRPALRQGYLTVETLCEAAVVMSDNSAANLLLPLVGGPAGLTRFARAHRDSVSRFDRDEPTLNTNLPHDPRDTTSPRAAVGLLERLLVGDVLAERSRAQLIGWMIACSTGKARLRAGLPPAWRAGDKTGTGERGAVNDVAIAFPAQGGAPVLMASYIDAPDVPLAVAEAAHAAAARLAARLFG